MLILYAIIKTGEIMSFKKFIIRNFSNKPVLVFVHGFSRRTSQPLKKAIDYFKQRGYYVIVPELFDPNNENDDIPIHWIDNAKKAVDDAFSIKDDVVVIGFSMGGVIASDIAATYPVKLLVLLAPAFEYVTLKAVKETISKKINKRNIQKINPKKLPENFVEAFKEVVLQCKGSIFNVHCPTIIFHGLVDETIPSRSSEFAYHNIPTEQKKLFMLDNVNHNIIEDSLYGDDIIQLIETNIEQLNH